jgi:hypothetical protein
MGKSPKPNDSFRSSLALLSRCRPEAAFALRLRLNEVVEQLDALREDHNQLQVTFESQNRELVVAKSDRIIFLLTRLHNILPDWMVL